MFHGCFSNNNKTERLETMSMQNLGKGGKQCTFWSIRTWWIEEYVQSKAPLVLFYHHQNSMKHFSVSSSKTTAKYMCLPRPITEEADMQSDEPIGIQVLVATAVRARENTCEQQVTIGFCFIPYWLWKRHVIFSQWKVQQNATNSVL